MPTPAYATAHNGGKGQTNLNEPNDGGCFAFLNHVKNGATLKYVFPENGVDPRDLDSNGYPTVINSQGVKTLFIIPSQVARPGRYICKWDGNGTVAIGTAATVDSYSAGVTVSGFNNSSWTSSTGSGRVVLSNPEESVDLRITVVGSPIITNLRWVHESDETFLDNGEVFQYDFKRAILEGNFGAIRFLNWANTNLATSSTWSDRKPVSYFSYQSHELRSNMFAVAAWNGSKYVIASPPASWAGLVHGARLLVQFDTTATAACNLNVNSTGDVPIYNYAVSTVVGNNLPEAGKFCHLFYDAAIGAWIKIGGDSDHGNCYLGSYVPWEIMFQLCAEVGAHPWFNLPHYSLTPMTDLAPSLAAYCVTNAPSWMVPQFECSNEFWNNASGFIQNYYANAKANALSYGSSGTQFLSWGGLANSTMGQAIASAYSVLKANVKTQTKYRAIGGVQTYGGGMNSDGTGLQAELFTSAQYLAGAYGPQSGYLKEAASGWLSHICWANYFSPAYYQTATETAMETAYAGYRATVNITGNTMTISLGGNGGTTGTISNATPGVVTATNNYIADEPVTFSTDNGTVTPGVLPTQIIAGTTYYVTGTGLSGSAYSVASAPGGAAINTSGGSGTIGIQKLMQVDAKLQTNLSVHGQGAQARLIPDGTKISSGSGSTWTLNKSVTSPVVQSGVYGGLDDTLPRAFAESCSVVGTFSIPGCIRVYNGIKAFAVSLGMTKGTNYEGGYSMNSATALEAASCQVDKVAKYVALNNDALYALNGGGFTFDYPSNFMFSARVFQPNGVYAKGTAWSVLDDLYQNPRVANFIATAVYNKGVSTLTVKS